MSTNGLENVYALDLRSTPPPLVRLAEGFDAAYLYAGADGGLLYFQTTLDAPRGRVIAIDPTTLESKQVFYPAKDGTRIPIYLVYRKGLKLAGTNPTLLYGCGGFGIPLVPHFDAARLAWLEQGGLFAMANIGGGGEYGEAWHRQAIRARKQVGFDDFIAAAEWLIKERYTSTSKLAIEGGSNGGLLVGACLTQRPDLYGAVLAYVGVMDMLRFSQFGQGGGPNLSQRIDETADAYAFLVKSLGMDWK